MNETINRKYVITLAGLAAAILTLGVFLRPKQTVPDRPAPPTESVTLEARVRREELGQTATFFAQRAETLAGQVVYEREHGSSAIAWEKNGLAITTRGPDSEPAEAPVSTVATNTGFPAVYRSTEPPMGHWILIVARTADGQVLWEPAVYGGAKQATCASAGYRELIVNARLDSTLSGAAAFDLDGVLVGMVIHCGNTYHVASASSLEALLQAYGKPERKIQATFGFHVVEPGTEFGRLMDAETASGLFVTDVRLGDAADRAGLRAGDLLTGVGGQPLSHPDALWTALEGGDAADRTLDVVRSRRKLTVAMPDPDEAEAIRKASDSLGMRIVPAPAASEAIYVAPGTPAFEAGLRTGDRLVAVGGKDVRGGTAGERSARRKQDTALLLSRAISASGKEPLLVLFQRNLTMKAAVISQ